jgi:hypothetical protein
MAGRGGRRHDGAACVIHDGRDFDADDRGPDDRGLGDDCGTHVGSDDATSGRRVDRRVPDHRRRPLRRPGGGGPRLRHRLRGLRRPGIYGGQWQGPVFVLTHRPPEYPTDDRVTFVSTSLAEPVATARAAASGKNVVVFGANLTQQCLGEGLLDEIVIHLAPVLLGDGIRLFAATDGKPVALRRTTLAESGQITDLRFSVVK